MWQWSRVIVVILAANVWISFWPGGLTKDGEDKVSVAAAMRLKGDAKKCTVLGVCLCCWEIGLASFLKEPWVGTKTFLWSDWWQKLWRDLKWDEDLFCCEFIPLQMHSGCRCKHLNKEVALLLVGERERERVNDYLMQGNNGPGQDYIQIYMIERGINGLGENKGKRSGPMQKSAC